MSTPVRYCSHNDCSDRYYARGWCVKHYSERRRRETSDYLPPDEWPPVCICDVPQLGAFGECQLCYRSAHIDNADFREAWRARLNMTSAGSAGAPLPVEPADLAAPAAANEGASPAAGSLNFSP